MKKLTVKSGRTCLVWLAMAVPLTGSAASVPTVAAPRAATEATASSVASFHQINPTTVEVRYVDGTRMTVDFYGENVFRLFRDNKGGIVRDPQASP